MAKTILTVDDSPSMRMLLRAALTDLGYEIEEAEDGVHALEKLEGLTPDLMITDINMPRLDGFGLIAFASLFPILFVLVYGIIRFGG